MNGRIIISKKLVLVNTASSLVTRLLSITVLIWVQQYLLKKISVEEYSLLPLVFSMMIFLPFFTEIFTSGMKRYVAEAYAKNDEERITRIVSSMLPLLFVVSFVLILLGALFIWKIENILKIDEEYIHDARLMLILIIGVEVFRLPVSAFGGGIFAHQRFVLKNAIDLVSEIIRIAILFILLLFVNTSVVSVVIASTVASSFTLVSVLLVSIHLLPSQRFRSSKFDRSVIGDLIGFGGWSSVYGISGMIRKAADPLILNRFATPLDVTCFHLGALVPNRLEIIANQSVLGSVAPVVVGLHTDKQDEKLKRMYLRLGRYAMWGMLFVICPFVVHFNQIVTLYVGEIYLAAGTVMLLLLSCYPIVYGNILHQSLAVAKLRMRSLAIRESMSAVLNLALTLALVGYYQMGAIGAATSTFLIYGLGSILLIWPFGKDIANASWHEIWNEIFIPGITPLIAALISMNMLKTAYFPNSWTAIGINASLGMLIYLLVLWFAAKEIDRFEFRQTLSKLITRKWSA